MDESYLDAVRLLLKVAPTVFRNPLFALKGGTAINLFVRDMPRLSVDLDLAIVDHTTQRDEVLFGNEIDIGSAFANEFEGMTRPPVTLDDLLDARRRLFAELPSALTPAQRAFLLGLVKGEPDWSLMTCPHLRDMPAIRWKLENISRLQHANPRKFALQADELEAKF